METSRCTCQCGAKPLAACRASRSRYLVTPYLLGYLVNSHTFQIFVICSPPLSPWENPFESLDLPPGFGCFCAHGLVWLATGCQAPCVPVVFERIRNLLRHAECFPE